MLDILEPSLFKGSESISSRDCEIVPRKRFGTDNRVESQRPDSIVNVLTHHDAAVPIELSDNGSRTIQLDAGMSGQIRFTSLVTQPIVNAFQSAKTPMY